MARPVRQPDGRPGIGLRLARTRAERVQWPGQATDRGGGDRLPMFGLFAGVITDRIRWRPVMIAMGTVRLLIFVSLRVAAAFGVLSMVQLFVAAALASGCQAHPRRHEAGSVTDHRLAGRRPAGLGLRREFRDASRVHHRAHFVRRGRLHVAVAARFAPGPRGQQHHRFRHRCARRVSYPLGG